MLSVPTQLDTPCTYSNKIIIKPKFYLVSSLTETTYVWILYKNILNHFPDTFSPCTRACFVIVSEKVIINDVFYCGQGLFVHRSSYSLFFYRFAHHFFIFSKYTGSWKTLVYKIERLLKFLIVPMHDYDYESE